MCPVMFYIFVVFFRHNKVTCRMPVSVEDSCRHVIGYVDLYTGASFFYVALVHYECLDIRLIERLDLFRAADA